MRRFAVFLVLFFLLMPSAVTAGSGLTVWEKFTTGEIAGEDLIGMTDVSDSGGTSKAGTVTQLVDYLSTFFGEGGTGTFDPSADITFLGNIDLSQAASVLFGPIYLNEPAADGTSYVSFSVPALAANRTITVGDYNMQVPREDQVNADGTLVLGLSRYTGSAALGTTAVAAGACRTVSSANANVVAGDVPSWAFAADPTAATGYAPAGDLLYITVYATTGNVNFRVCNGSANSIIPGAVSVNWSLIK